MKEIVKTLLCDIIRQIAPDFMGDVLVEISKNKNHGDYTTNVAFSLSKLFGESPKKIAENLVEKLNNEKSENFSRIEAMEGFVNFFLSEKYLFEEVEKILKKKDKYGSSPSSLRLRRINEIHLDFVSANPTGPLTMGNGRGGFYGDVLANVLESQGNEVAREYYINDRGEQILALGRSIKMAQGFKIENERIYAGGYIDELAKEIDKNLNESEAGQEAAGLILEKYIKPAVKKAGIKFNNWFSEKSLYNGDDYEKIMKKLMRKNLVYEQDGATWMKTTEFGDTEDRVLIKKNGEETYFMSDILYHADKINIRKFDKAIDIWGADHHGYAPRLKAALKALEIPESKLEIIISQLVRLVENGKEVKISKRAGNFITLEELIDEVGLDAARFFFLSYSPDTHMDFDLALAKERSQKNPVYYAQYAHARIANILRKFKILNSTSETNAKFKIQNLKLLKEKEELNLIRKLIEFPELLEEVSKSYEVHRLPRYVLELAKEFHNFYEKQRVIMEDENLTAARLSLVSAVKIVLTNALNLLGIKAPDKM